MKLTVFVLLSMCLLTVSCSVAVSEKRWDKPTNIRFGTILSEEQIPLSEIGEATIVGGFRGIAGQELSSRAKQNVALRLKDGTTYLYTIRRNSGSIITYATEKQFMQTGDCVAIEYGPSPNLRLVGDTNCQPTTKQAKQATTAQEIAASQCLLAKRQVILAQSEPQLATANRQVEELCRFQR